MAMEERRLDKALCDWFADSEILDTTIGGLLRDQAAASAQVSKAVNCLCKCAYRNSVSAHGWA